VTTISSPAASPVVSDGTLTLEGVLDPTVRVTGSFRLNTLVSVLLC